MPYLVLARKWRPQIFEELVGQDHVTKTLQNAISTSRLAHAFLFTGPRGVGKTSAARILAKAVNCQQGPTPRPCNQCENCKEIANTNSIDVLEIDGASNTGVDNVRELRENVKYLPGKSKYKIYIIDEVHMLSTSAFNALLKTLEEPPPHVLFIFATTEPHKIPLTILSRCQRFDFKRVPLALIFEKLKEIAIAEGVRISDDTLMLIAREAEGSMRDAQSLLDQAISYGGEEVKGEDVLDLLGITDRKILFDISAAIIQGDAKTCLYLVDELYKIGYDLGQFCKDLLNHFRNLLVVKIEGGESPILNVPDHEANDLLDQAAGVGFEDLYRWFQILLKGEELMARSPFPKVVLEMTLVEMARLRSLLPAEEILSRVERLEGALSQGIEGAEGPPLGPVEQREGGRVKQENLQDTPTVQQMGRELGQEDLGQWEDFLKFLRGENPILASFLNQGRPVRLDDSSMEIGFARGSFALDRVSEPGTLKSLEEVSQRYFKKEVKVKITSIDPTGKANGDPNTLAQDEETDLTRHLKKEALANPVVKEVVEIFKGRIVGVKVKEGS
ncbi:MAG: DNA polymerase III subunit gamma/tau [Deltaproteobacteria bacterium]|nr:DNA polymerase III subunit gamma/tau [Deltaproteobacteria bacterium]